MLGRGFTGKLVTVYARYLNLKIRESICLSELTDFVSELRRISHGPLGSSNSVLKKRNNLQARPIRFGEWFERKEDSESAGVVRRFKLLSMQNLEHASILDQVIRDRRSIRSFLARPVPPALLEEALVIAQRAPSNSNVQPWRLIVATGARRDSLSRALRIAAERDPFPNIFSPLPKEYQHRRSELGEIFYGALGIARDDQKARRKALLRNYDFFDAPVVGILCMPESLGVADAVSVGIYLQTLMLSLTARGLGCCAQVALAGYPEVLRSELKIPSELLIICGLAIGYADPEFPANHLYTPRAPLSETVTLL